MALRGWQIRRMGQGDIMTTKTYTIEGKGSGWRELPCHAGDLRQQLCFQLLNDQEALVLVRKKDDREYGRIELVDAEPGDSPNRLRYLIPADRWEKLRKLVAENNKNIGFMNEKEIKISLVYLLAAIEAIEEEV